MQSPEPSGTCPECGKRVAIVSHLSCRHVLCGEGFYITNTVYLTYPPLRDIGERIRRARANGRGMTPATAICVRDIGA